MSGLTPLLGLSTPAMADSGDQFIADMVTNWKTIDTVLGAMAAAVGVSTSSLRMVTNQKGLIVKTSTGVQYLINVSDGGVLQATAV